MRSYFDRLSALTRSRFRLVRAGSRACGAASHARRRSETLEAAPAGCTRPSEAAPERFRPRLGASGASKTKEFLKKTINSCFLLFLLPTRPRRSETLPERPPGRPSGAPRWSLALPESSPEPPRGVSRSHFARLRLLKPVPAGSARPSDAAPERIQPRFGASGSSKRRLGSCAEHCRIV